MCALVTGVQTCALPSLTASMTALPVLGVPVQSKALDGMDSLLSIVQMPAGVPVGTLALGKAGAINAAIPAAAILATADQALGARLAARSGDAPVGNASVTTCTTRCSPYP